MTISDLRALDEKALLLKRQELIGELASLKFRHASGQLDDTASIGKVRRTLAKLNTVVRERELAAGLGKGGLARQIGKLEGGTSAFATFRERLSGVAQNG